MRKKQTSPVTHFSTDGLKIYPSALSKAYGFNKHKNKFTHQIRTSTDELFNWKIERLHNSIRERTKIMRGFKSLPSARAIMKGWEIYYNFCRKHQGLHKYPFELATDVKLEDSNRWLELIQLGSQA